MRVDEILAAHEWLANLASAKTKPTEQDLITSIALLKKLLAVMQQNFTARSLPPEEKWLRHKLEVFRALLP